MPRFAGDFGNHVENMLDDLVGARRCLDELEATDIMLRSLLLAFPRRRLPSIMNMTAITTRAATLPTTGAAIQAREVPSPSTPCIAGSEGAPVPPTVMTRVMVAPLETVTEVMTDEGDVESDSEGSTLSWTMALSTPMLGMLSLWFTAAFR